jgi:hypothetical protein
MSLRERLQWKRDLLDLLHVERQEDELQRCEIEVLFETLPGMDGRAISM